MLANPYTENWNAVMYDGWRAAGWPAVLYFLALILMGMFIVMNLFVAILLSHFSDDDEGEADTPAAEKVETAAAESDTASAAAAELIAREVQAETEKLREDPNADSSAFPLSDGKALFCLGPEHPVRVTAAHSVNQTVIGKFRSLVVEGLSGHSPWPPSLIIHHPRRPDRTA